MSPRSKYQVSDESIEDHLRFRKPDLVKKIEQHQQNIDKV